MAAAEKLDRGYLGRILQLTLLAPDIVEAILDGRHAAELGLPNSCGQCRWMDRAAHRVCRRRASGAAVGRPEPRLNGCTGQPAAGVRAPLPLLDRSRPGPQPWRKVGRNNRHDHPPVTGRGRGHARHPDPPPCPKRLAGDRPIEVIVPYPPGGGVDTMARVILPFVAQHCPGRASWSPTAPARAGRSASRRSSTPRRTATPWARWRCRRSAPSRSSAKSATGRSTSASSRTSSTTRAPSTSSPAPRSGRCRTWCRRPRRGRGR